MSGKVIEIASHDDVESQKNPDTCEREQLREESQEQLLTTKEIKEHLEQINLAKSKVDEVNLFGTVMDQYGVDALAGLFEGVGDVATATISTMYLLYQGQKVGLSWKEILQIVGYQAADLALGAIPVVGDVADFFFKSNKMSAQIFQEHLDSIREKAIAHGVSPEDIDELKGNQVAAALNQVLPMSRKAA